MIVVAEKKMAMTANMSSDPSSHPSDEQSLIARLRAGEQAAFTQLVERYHGALLRLARIFVAEGSAAEEVVQDTWLAVINGLSGFESRSTLRTWLFRILTNRAKTRGIRDKRSIPFSSLNGGHADDPEPALDTARFTSAGMWADPPGLWDADTPEKLLAREETMSLLTRAVAELPPNQRAVVSLRDVEGLDADEVCNVLEIAETNQRVLLHRGRSKLRAALEKRFEPGSRRSC
jgi:RNA polymerase sigma-70 factor, ECF subfamily